jgi:uncharacterized membrane protein YbhN (UPF0104 family)
MNFIKERSTTLLLVVLLASIFYVGLAIWGSSGRQWARLATLNITTIVLLVVLVSAGYFLRYIRWEYYLEELDYQVPRLANLRIFLASFLMAISPGKVGEAAKSYFLRQEFNIPATPTVAAFFCERFTDVLAMILLTTIGVLVYPNGSWILLFIIFLQLLVLVALQYPSLMESLLFTPLSELDLLSNSIDRMRTFYERSGDLLALRNLLIATGLALLSWALEGLCLWIILRELGFTALSIPMALFVFSASVLLGAAAMLPGGLGSSEALMIAMLIYFGAPRETAVTATILVRLITLWYGVALGGLCWGLSWKRLKSLKET